MSSPQTSDILKKRLGEIVRRDEKHADYVRVNELHKLYKQLITGEGMGELLQQFTPRETKELFEQRVRITQHVTKTVSQNVMDIFFKVPRSNSVQRNISYVNNDIKSLKELNAKLNEFWGDSSLDDYMNTRWFELNFIDPNAFIVTEWNQVDTTKERYMPYPFEVDSKMAIQYEYFNNDLIYLVSEQEKKYLVWNRKEKKDIEYKSEIYTIYGLNSTVKFTQLEKDVATVIHRNNKATINELWLKGEFFFTVGDIEYFIADNNKEEIYLVEEFTHNLGYVPAKRVGFKRDLFTNGRTFVSPLDKATPILMKMVKANSELDLTMALHAFPQKIQYSSRCKAHDCKEGTTLDGNICQRCNGSGYEIITSAQDAITLAMPKTKEEMADLSNIIRYEYPPVDLVKFQKEYIDSLTVYVKEAVFNTELFSKKEVSETATGKNISLQNVYDSLYPVASAYSKVWEFLVTTVADIIELSNGLIAFYHFSKDFKLKSLSDLYMDLKMVGDARASEFVKSAIETDIASIIYSEDERALKKYNVKQSFFPFSGKTPEQITLLMGGNSVTSFTKCFYANFGQVFDIVEMEQANNSVDFYDLDRTKQMQLIEKVVNDILANIEEEQPEPQMLNTDEAEKQTETGSSDGV